MGQADSLRLLCASLAATAVLAFALGAASTLWLLSPHLPKSAATAPPAVSVTGLAVPAAQAAAPPTSAQAAAPPTATPAPGTEEPAPAATPPAAAVATPPAAAPAPAAGKAAAAAAPPPMSPRALSDNRGQTYQVHLGTFRDAAIAERLATALQQRGFAIGVVETPLGDSGTWHQARSPEFARRTDALRLAAHLHRELGIDPLVVRAAPAAAPTRAGAGGAG